MGQLPMAGIEFALRPIDGEWMSILWPAPCSVSPLFGPRATSGACVLGSNASAATAGWKVYNTEASLQCRRCLDLLVRVATRGRKKPALSSGAEVEGYVSMGIANLRKLFPAATQTHAPKEFTIVCAAKRKYWRHTSQNMRFRDRKPTISPLVPIDAEQRVVTIRDME